MKREEITTFQDVLLDPDLTVDACTYVVGPRQAIKQKEFYKLRKCIALQFGKFQSTYGECGTMLVPSQLRYAATSLAVAITPRPGRWGRSNGVTTWEIDTLTSQQVLMPWAQYEEILAAVRADAKRHDEQRRALEGQRDTLRQEIIGLLGFPKGTRLVVTNNGTSRQPEYDWTLRLDADLVDKLITKSASANRKRIRALQQEILAIKDPAC